MSERKYGPYKGFTGTAKYDPQEDWWHGDLDDISDVVTFAGTGFDDIAQAFRDSVDCYLEWTTGV